MSKSNAFETNVLEIFLEAVAVANLADNAATAPLTNLYLSLHTADPGETGDQTTNEVAYTGYARKAIARSAASWTITNGQATLATSLIPLAFPTATAGSTLATHWVLGTAASGTGKALYRGALSSSISISAGVMPRVTALTINED